MGDGVVVEGGPTYLSKSGDLHDVDTLEGHDAARQSQERESLVSLVHWSTVDGERHQSSPCD